jgi:hypothetical protein
MTSVKLKLKESDVQKLKEVAKSFDNKAGELINVLHKAQEIFGYLPAEVQEVVAEELNVPVAKVYGVVTFIPSLLCCRVAGFPSQFAQVLHVMCVELRKFLMNLSGYLKFPWVKQQPMVNFQLPVCDVLGLWSGSCCDGRR